jgi:carboxypeptidase T
MRYFLCLMLSAFILFSSSMIAGAETKMLVRIHAPTPVDLHNLPRGLDVAGSRVGEGLDVVVTEQEFGYLGAQGLTIDVLADDVQALEESFRAFYPTWPQVLDSLIYLANHYAITSLDTLGWSYEGRPILCLKISDQVETDDPTEPDLGYDGLIHAREWPTVPITLFLCDTLCRGYGVDPHITELVDSREVWVVPCLNPDGYVYSHDQGHDWRKNRRPVGGGYYGVDLNRNSNGGCMGLGNSRWGFIPCWSVSHHPSTSVYCGPWGTSEAETKAIRDLIEAHDFVIYMDYHTYGEMIMWPWGHEYGADTPDSDLYWSYGEEIAGRIGYDAFPAYMNYLTSGTLKDHIYGYNHYMKGAGCLAFIVEACDQFQPPESQLDQIVRDNFKGLIYTMEIAEELQAQLIPRVAFPTIVPMSTDDDGTYTVEWVPVNPEANPTAWELEELTDLEVVTDDAESGMGLWDLDGGFNTSTSRYHSSNHSFYSNVNTGNDVATMTMKYPISVSAGDSVTFWCWYSIEPDYDKAFCEISPTGREWFLVDSTASFDGSSGGWVRKAFSLDAWAGHSVNLRFRYITDDGTEYEGFYVDDIHPVPDYGTVTILSSSIEDTCYTVTGRTEGIYFYHVKGYNDARGWCDYSELEDIEVTGGAPLTITVTPDASTVVRGEYLGYTVEVTNNTGSPVTFDYWSDVYLPNGKPYVKNPVFGPKEVTLNAYQTRSAHLSHQVPNNAPLKTYSLCGRIGDHPGEIWTEDCFDFTVVEG